MNPTALLLDLDGTLVDSEPLHQAAYRTFFERRGWEVPDLTIFTGRRAEDVFVVEPGPWTGLDPAALAQEVMAFVFEGEKPAPVAGAVALIAAARRHQIPLAVVTSAGPDWVQHAVGGTLDSLHHMEVIVTRDDVAEGKPDPAGYLLACSQLGVEASGAMAVEDSPAGVRAALDAGVGHVVGVGTTHDIGELTAAGAHAVLPDLTDLVDLLR